MFENSQIAGNGKAVITLCCWRDPGQDQPCGQPARRGNRYCKKHHAEYMKAYRANRPAESLASQLALLRAMADKPLTLPPIFVKITGSITAGLLLRQVIYWMGKTTDPGGWFYKRLPEFQDEMCMGEKEFRSAREVLDSLDFLETERRGVPPVVWFRADLVGVIEALSRHTKGEGYSGEKAESIPPKGQNQFGQNAAAIPPKGQNLNSAEKAESYKEAETTRDYGHRGGTPRNGAQLIAEERFFKLLDRQTIDPTKNHDAEQMRVVHSAAAESRIGRTAAKWLLKEHPDWKGWKYLELIDSQAEIEFPADPKARKPAPEFQPPAGWDQGSARDEWQRIFEYCRSRISQHSFETWFKPLRADGLRGSVLFVRVPTQEFSFITEKYGDVIQAAMDESGDGPKEIVFVTSDQLASYDFGEKATA